MKRSKSTKTIEFTVGSPFISILRFALPVIRGNLFQLFYTLADSVIVGQTLGAESLAAVGATSIIVYFVLCFIQGITNGFGICLGQKCGAKDEKGMKKCIAATAVLCIGFTIIITALFCGFSHPILRVMKTPQDIYKEAYIYMFIILLGSGATFFYNAISNILRALGDSEIPLFCLIFSSILNIVLDIVFIIPMKSGIAGAAWATVLSQFVSAILCTAAGVKKFRELHLSKQDFEGIKPYTSQLVKVGFPMGFQMSVMCIGQLSMQSAVNSLGSQAIAGYTAATKADQISVLVNNAMSSTLSAYVSQNYGARNQSRISQGVRAALVQTEVLNIVMCAGILLLRNVIVEMFIANPVAEIRYYSNGYLYWIAPSYVLLGILTIYRCAIQSMQNTVAPFFACFIELVMRIGSTMLICSMFGYIGVCVATPLAWLGACVFLVPVYYIQIRSMTDDSSTHFRRKTTGKRDRIQKK